MHWIKALTTALGIALTGGAATAQEGQKFFFQEVSPETIGPIGILTTDSTADRCWTNFEESETYASDQLQSAGYEVRKWDDSDVAFIFLLEVNAKRSDAGQCFGYVRVSVSGLNVLYGMTGLHEIGKTSAIALTNDNFNAHVLNSLKFFIGEM